MTNENNISQNAGTKYFKANYSVVKFVVFSLLTFGIYGIYTMAKMGEHLNMLATRHDGQKTMNFWLLFFLVGPITLEIGTIVWYHKFSKRIGNEQIRRELPRTVGAGTFWLWNVLGCIILIGPLVYMYKIMKAMNLLEEDYNKKGL